LGEKKNLQREIIFEKEIFLQKKSLFQKLSLSTPTCGARFPTNLICGSTYFVKISAIRGKKSYSTFKK
jgi:hypothetical protein